MEYKTQLVLRLREDIHNLVDSNYSSASISCWKQAVIENEIMRKTHLFEYVEA